MVRPTVILTAGLLLLLLDVPGLPGGNAEIEHLYHGRTVTLR